MYIGRQSAFGSLSAFALEIAWKHQPLEPSGPRAQIRPTIDLKLKLDERASRTASAEPCDVLPRSVSNQNECEVVQAGVMPNKQYARMFVWCRSYGSKQVLGSGKVQGIVGDCRDLDTKLG